MVTSKGENAPISEAAAFAYTTALNRFLERGSANRIQIGDASTIFWADATNAEAAKEAEDIVLRVAEYGRRKLRGEKGSRHSRKRPDGARPGGFHARSS